MSDNAFLSGSHRLGGIFRPYLESTQLFSDRCMGWADGGASTMS